MGFEQLEKAVIDKANKEAEAIIKEARKQAKDILGRTKKECDELQSRYQSETKRMLDMIERRELASSRLEAKKMMLQTKKQLLDTVFVNAKRDISKKLGNDEKAKVCQKLLAQANSELDVGKIFCSENDLSLFPDAQSKEMLGGLIVESKDGTTMIDYSFDSLLDDIKENNIAEVTAILTK